MVCLLYSKFNINFVAFNWVVLYKKTAMGYKIMTSQFEQILQNFIKKIHFKQNHVQSKFREFFRKCPSKRVQFFACFFLKDKPNILF